MPRIGQQIARRWAGRGAVVAVVLAGGAGVGVALAGSGGLDPSFGTGGTTVLERPTSTYPVRTELAGGGKIVAVSSDEGVITVSRLLPDGAPDPTFDGDGKAVIETEGNPNAHAVAVQPDGKIVVVGFRNVGATGEDAMVWRLKADGGSGAPNGALDPTFATNGTADLKPATDSFAEAVAIRPDGKIVVAGTAFDYETPKSERAVVWRLTSVGGLDPGFDTDGVAAVSDAHEDYVKAVAVAPDGKILIAGTTEFSTNPRDAVVWRLKADGGPGALNGALDTTFDTDGQADIDSGADEAAEAIALQPDGRIVLAGYSSGGGQTKAMVWRMKPDGGSGVTNGALDPTFDTDGAAVIDGGGYAFAGALALQPDGKMLVAGSRKVGTDPFTSAVWRLLANGGTGADNGALDPTFATGGTAAVVAGSFADSLALTPDRRVVVAGSVEDTRLLLFRVLGDPFSVSVAKAGAGGGSVQSSSPGIECGSSCSAPFDDGATITLTATPAAGSSFAGWSGAGCSGVGACALSMSADRTVTATFNPLPPAGSPPPPGAKHFALKAALLHMAAFRHSARIVRASVTGLPVGTKISASILAGRTVLARARATAGAGGRASLKFTFSKVARRRVRSTSLKAVTLRVIATPKGDTASRASKRVKFKRSPLAHRAH